MRNFTISGYLIGVDGHRMIIKVADRHHDRVEMIKTFYKKSDQTGHFITINSKGATYKIINLKWSNPKDLIGVELTIQCVARTYENFRKQLNSVGRRQMSNQVVEYIPEAVPVTLVSFMAKIITNIAEDTKA